MHGNCFVRENPGSIRDFFYESLGANITRSANFVTDFQAQLSKFVKGS